MHELGVYLKKMRKRSGFTQEALAEKLHMSVSNISKLESNRLEIRARDFLEWVKQTNSQDYLIALVMNIDLSTVSQFIAQIAQVATIFLGGIA